MKRPDSLEFAGSSRRLDSFLAGEFREFSRGFLKKLILDGAVTVDNVKRKPAWLLASGNRIHITWPEPRLCGLPPGDASRPSKEKSRIEPLVLYEDKDILAVSKPSGLMVHPLGPSWERAYDASFAGEPTLVSWILSARPEIASSGVTRMGLVHRLDRGTSGVMLVAKTPLAQEKLLAQFRERKIEKTYTGAAHGELEKNKGIIEAPTGRIAGSKKITVSGIGRYASTEFEVILRKKGYTLLKLYPKTGRTNQLRVHLSWIGHPVVGDFLYRGKSVQPAPPEFMRDREQPAPRLMLHSKKIVFMHPVTGRKTSVESPLPEDFTKEWKKLTA